MRVVRRQFPTTLKKYRYLNQIANIITILTLSILLLSVTLWVVRLPYFVIDTIQIEGLENKPLVSVTPSSVNATIAGEIKGGFFTVDIDEARQIIETAPWVRHAQVRRVWPNKLQVKIEEHKLMAYWNESDMINTWGEPFTANAAVLNDDEFYPQLNGPASSVRLVLQRYPEVEQWINLLGLRIKEFSLSPRYAWDAVLSNGMQLHLGREPAVSASTVDKSQLNAHGTHGAEDFSERLKRLVVAWPTLMERLDGRTLERIDLRYSNGFAIELHPFEITEDD